MSALELISLINQLLFVGLFALVLWHALKRPSRAAWNAALLFGSIAGVVILSRVLQLLGSPDVPWASGLTVLLLNVAPLAMLRLVDDFRGTPTWVQAAGIGAFALVATLGLATAPRLELAAVASIAFFGVVGGYAAAAFTAESRRTVGLSSRRMGAVAAGAVLFVVAVLIVFAGALAPAFREASGFVVQLLVLGAAAAFFFGFTPPTWIRRAWREPDLRGFLERSIHLAGEPDERTALLEMERAATLAFGASGASIGLADADGGTLRYATPDGWVTHDANRFVGGRAFASQRRVVAIDATADDPENTSAYLEAGARTVIAAPISTEDRRLGVLAVYAERAPLFVEDDLWLLELLADQAAVLLEARTLAAHASELRAREDAARLKEEFLSAAAHDLRTPLTVVLAQAELLERRLDRDPTAGVEPVGVRRIAREARRLRDLVTDLLDAQRLQHARVVMNLREHDLRDVVTGVAERYADHGTPLSVSVPDHPVRVRIDVARIEQVVENLVDNALKYGADGEAPTVTVELDPDTARIAVMDRGIGVPSAERGRLFERFFRASNAHDVTDTGIGLGLFTCRRILDGHGGTIGFTPTDGGGSTFTVRLPLLPSLAERPLDEPRAGALADGVVADA